MQPAIVVENLGKRFRRYSAKRPVTVMEAAIAKGKGLSPVDEFWALRDLSFQVQPGEMLGAIGRNGAGKSTLLQMLGGVGRPTEGYVNVRGRIGALLDLGAGFHPDLTGRENAFVCGVAAGLARHTVQQRFEDIVEFAELSAFIDNPLRTYSTGMQMRLAFAIAIHTDPEVLLVDEFLSVGDLAFQAKCLDRIDRFKAAGGAIVLVSHDAEQVRRLCDRVLWLQQGEQIAYGEPEVVVGQYVSAMRSETQRRTPNCDAQLASSGVELRVNENRFGSLEVEIASVKLLPAAELNSGESLSVEIEYLSPYPISAPIFSVTLSDVQGQVLLDTNTAIAGLSLSQIEGRGWLVLNLERLDLVGGSYFVDVGVYQQDWSYAYDYHWHVYPLVVRSTANQQGLLSPPLRWDTRQLHSTIAKSSI